MGTSASLFLKERPSKKAGLLYPLEQNNPRFGRDFIKKSLVPFKERGFQRVHL
jgi:hypothetical protein